MRDVPYTILLQYAPSGHTALSAAGAEPVPGGQQTSLHPAETDRPADDPADLGVRLHIGGGERRDVDRVTDRLVAGGVDDVPQRLEVKWEGSGKWSKLKILIYNL